MQMLKTVYAENGFYESGKLIRIYIKHDVQRSNFINVEIDFIDAEKQILTTAKFKYEKAFRFGVYIYKTRFLKVFYERTGNNSLNSDQKIIFVEKKVNNFLNNAGQKIILHRMLEIFYVEYSEQFL